MRNGSPSKFLSVKIKKKLKYEELCEDIGKALDFKQKQNIRIFKSGAVEVLENEIMYIRDGDLLYISKGEDFDDSSNFAEYTISRTLGQGGYGKVYQAVNRLSGENVAIKMLDRNKVSKKAFFFFYIYKGI